MYALRDMFELELLMKYGDYFGILRNDRRTKERVSELRILRYKCATDASIDAILTRSGCSYHYIPLYSLDFKSDVHIGNEIQLALLSVILSDFWILRILIGKVENPI